MNTPPAGKPYWTDPGKLPPEPGEPVEISGHQSSITGWLVAIGVTDKGPVAVCWVGDELKTFSLHVNGHGGLHSIRKLKTVQQKPCWP